MLNDLSSRESENAPVAHWYRQFWPWFLLALPAVVVVASLVTVAIAFYHSDSLVVDNYYREGLAINRKLALDEAAATRAISAQLDIWQNGLIKLKVLEKERPFQRPAGLQLQWQHPTKQASDFSMQLKPGPGGLFSTAVESVPAGRWYVTVTSTSVENQSKNAETGGGTGWRLKQEILIAPDSPVTATNPQYQSFQFLPRCALADPAAGQASRCRNE
ncbi:MAG: FixH family protein [Gammaproteobacteria bacterium]|nr:FixH family protein [Gammaproteobacteria bacterium]NND38472.1 FixH family protein [Pseudomonadales bacterium]MBT8150407.1 FixH family protein [Gammaproteobacteria bacterium]NNL11676.1 FixH family protein [Pseudomonadales bacterium]NNM11570.1 FixH family protein [Pseudomonadales bacterium]